MTIKLITAFVLAFLFASAFGKVYIPWLRRQNAGQQVKSQVIWHTVKSGTPTMGGVIFILAAILVCLTVGFDGMLHGRFEHIFVLLFACVFGLIGVLDDWEKIRKNREKIAEELRKQQKEAGADPEGNGTEQTETRRQRKSVQNQNTGLSSRSKFLLQLAAAVIFILLMRRLGFVRPQLYIPFAQKTVSMPEWLYPVFAAFVIVGTVNAVNITDGIDGLASGTSIPVFLFFVFVCAAWGERFQELGVFASAMVGGLCGFLIYNFNPAKCFMGDTGSLFLGGAIAALAFACNMPLILITLGLVFIVETLSDIIQVGYFKLTKKLSGEGKRVFKMAPFHHHLEMGGWTGKKWKEKELFFLFTGVSLAMAIVSFLGVYQRNLY